MGIGPGLEVKQGDVLLKIDPTDFQLEVAVAEAKLAKAKADLAQTEAWKRPEEIRQLAANRDEAQARYGNAADQLERTKQLLKRNAVNRSEVDVKVSDKATAKAALDGQQALLALAESGPTKEEIAVQQALVAQAAAELQQKKRELEKTTITSPLDAVVTEISVEVGDRIGPTTTNIIELLDVRFLIAETGVPETMLGKIHIQDLADVKLAGIDDVVAGMVVAINGKVDPESRTFRVRVAIDNTERTFKAGQFATVVFRSGPETQQPCLSATALTFVEGQPHVFVVDEKSIARLRPVTVGDSSGDIVQVLSGVSVGENVITDDPALVGDGQAVTVVNE
jgi:multidrug resistance efflux pump